MRLTTHRMTAGRMTAGLFLALLLGVGGCASPTPAAVPVPTAAVLPDAAQCAKKGGEIRPVCRRGTPTCVLAYADAGRTCSDSSQCQGRCVVDRENELPAPAAGKSTGVCEADSDPCGCSAEVIGGVAQPARCVD